MTTLDISYKPERAHLRRPKAGVLAGPVVPQSVSGRYRRIKWAVLAVCLALYYIVPFLRFDRGPGQPAQAVMADLERGRFYFFWIEIWPQEVYYLTGLLILATLVLVLLNAVAGRVWCGYLCPQTVWTDLFLFIERRIEGDRRERLKKREQGLTARRVGELVLKHGIWLLIALGTGGVFVLYFADAPTLVRDLATGQASSVAYGCLLTLTLTTYTLAGLAREQVCTWMCPWPRLQGAIWDPDALTVNYRDHRGEPRVSAKKAIELRAAGAPAGDCVDCNACVAVCPIGIDIREGPNFACINCGLCVDACDTTMLKLGRSRGLIDYESWNNLLGEQKGEPRRATVLRPKVFALAAAILLLTGGMGTLLAIRSDVSLSVIHDRAPMAVRLSDGSVRNGYALRISNQAREERSFAVTVAGIDPAGLQVVGDDAVVTVSPDQTRELRVLLRSPDNERREVTFTATDRASGRSVSARDVFMPMEGGR